MLSSVSFLQLTAASPGGWCWSLQCFLCPQTSPAVWLWLFLRAQGYPAGGTRWGMPQGSGAGTEVGAGTKPCGFCGEAGSWPGLGGLWLSGPQCPAQGRELDRTLQEGADGAAWPVPLPVCQDAGWALTPLFPSSQPHLC